MPTPLSEEFTFKLGDSGIILNTDSSSLPFVDITGVNGLDNAPYRETQRDHEGEDGGFIDAEFEKGRPIALTGDVYADAEDMESYLDSLKENYAPSRTLIPLYFKAPGVDERLIFVKPLGCRYDWTQARRIGTTPIRFAMYAEDPRIYSGTETTDTVLFAEGSANGFGFDLGFSFGFGGTVGGSEGAFITNIGNRPTPLEFTINGPCDTPVIRNVTYSLELVFNVVLATGQSLVINTQYKTVRLDGTTNYRHTLEEPNWFYLEPGDTFIEYNALSGTGSSLDIRYRSAWR